MLAAAMARAHKVSDPERFASMAFLIWQLGESTMRLAISVDRNEGAALVAAYKKMTMREIVHPRP
ncbi:hypothetical protein LZC94_14925 [Pendulispora albinea]|uniref:Tetracyclin repressor SCO1712-like C-terminal domain-containing protein n=2 Tax=Pendulispora albinea TaxID=2741071 RepID=A0ABZ2M7P0_9BACT